MTFVAVAFLLAQAAADRPRLAVFTDIGGDPDDQQSMVRLMTYTSEIEVEALLATSRMEHGDDPRPDLIQEIVEAYGRVHANLVLHDPRYPVAEALLSRIKAGRAGARRGRPFPVGPEMDTEASDFFISVVDRADPRPVHAAVWGGSSDLAQALDRVRRTRGAAKAAAFRAKVRVYAIGDQDGAGAWIRKEFPDLRYVEPTGGMNAVYRGMYHNDSRADLPLVGRGMETLNQEAWVRENVVEGHGALGAVYPQVNQNPNTARNRRGVKEGDTPSWFFVVPNGLGDPGEPTWGGWGGRFRHVAGGHFADAEDAHGSGADDRPLRQKWTVARWREAYQNDFAARMDWCVKPPKAANHPPIAAAGELRRTIVSGARVEIDASGSSDPDGDALSFAWFFYDEPSSYHGPLEIAGADGPKASFTAPAVSEAKTIHIILSVTDRGSPPLTRYRRMIVTVK